MKRSRLSVRQRQVMGWMVVAVFVVGTLYSPIGDWTGTIMGAWFIGTQKPWRGFVWLAAVSFGFGMLGNLFHLQIAHPAHAAEQVAGLVVASLLWVLSFSIYRVLSSRLFGLWSTLPLPIAAVATHVWITTPLAQRWSALDVHNWQPLLLFFTYWFAAIVVWWWNGASSAPQLASAQWMQKAESLALLESPQSGEPLHVERQKDGEALVSSSGESFPIRDGIASFVTPQDLSGLNLKYNHLYETIGGFYDDSQRVWCALSGMDRDSYVMCYLGLLEVKPGDRVLETSVGTGLNFQYLPREVKRFGLDLSREMLINCQTNLRRWRLDADLFCGNAEKLPFRDSSFDVVFHVGGINFFSNRAQAIREMIRVAKPGSLILIADETEEHVKGTYEKVPVTSGYFKGRQDAVAAPVDLLPAEMTDVALKTLQNGRFYALTFRKPVSVEVSV